MNNNTETNKVREEIKQIDLELKRRDKVAAIRAQSSRFDQKIEQFGNEIAYDRYLERADL